ncbi:GumC family protein [Sinorhizobium terangae]|uniref:GumC family protein n=1 Tax=Sinorhizobium terangae TaxID=110322 RepID=UPI0024B17017|nr:tyrosine-protein kinase domain-containing protein [Sinorhizobium terangae]WFU51033.1 Wzz/FepE/Etk N-terminal domain-containing protein [Sinorhizobium terangae]
MTTFVPDGSLSARAHYRESVEFAAQRSGHTIGLLDVWALIKRRIWLIASVVLFCTLLAAIASYTLPETYTASSEVVLERKDVRPFATDASLTSLERDRSAAETEMDVLQSREFAGRIVDRLNLIDDPNFNPFARSGKRPESLGDRLARYFAGIIGAQRPRDSVRPPPDERTQRDRAISAVLSQFTVSRTGESLAVRITVTNNNPKVAQELANTIASLYVEASLEFKQYERIADKERALNTGGAVAFLRQSMTQPLLITLRNEEARLQQNRAELAAKFGKNHPQMIDADSQIAGVRNMIEDEVQRILSDLEAESLKPSARIVSAAEVPNSPSFPKPNIIIPAAFTGSTLLAFLLALLLETADTRIRSGQRTSQLLRLPNLGYIPKVPKHLPGTKRSSCIPDWSNFTCAEAERSVYMACRYSEVKQPHRVVMVTSCLQDVANASTAWGIATAAAADGRPTVFVNLDFHQHNVPYLKSVERSPELIERYLRNEASLADVVQTIPTLPAFGFIDATPVMMEPFRSLDSEKLCELILALRQNGYEFIVLHAPPVLTSGDANWLSPFVDGVILLVSWGKTTEEQLLDSVSQLRMNHAPLIGTVIHQVNPEVHKSHHYGGFVITSKRIPAAGGWIQNRRRNGETFSGADTELEVNTAPTPPARDSLNSSSHVR